MTWLLEPLRYEFMQTAFLAAVLIGLTCSVLGVYVVQRRMAFIGDALAHTTLPGVVIAYLMGWNLSLGALGAGVSTAMLIGWISRREALKEDTAIGVVFTGAFAFGVFLMSWKRSFKDLTDMLFGNILGVSNEDLPLLVVVTAFVLITLFLFHKELELTSFDPTHAEVIGLKAHRLRYLLLLLLALAVVTGIQVVGVILTSALLVTPAATGSLLSDRLPRIMALSALTAVLSGIAGLLISYHSDTTSGPAIVLTCTGLFAVAWAWKTIAHAIAARKLREDDAEEED